MKRGLKKKAKQILAVTLSLLIAAGTIDYGGITAVNAQTKEVEKVITSFAELEDSIEEQMLPVGAVESDIVFPETLQVTVETTSEAREESEAAPMGTATATPTEEPAPTTSTEEPTATTEVTPAESVPTEVPTTETPTQASTIETPTVEPTTEPEINGTTEPTGEQETTVPASTITTETPDTTPEAVQSEEGGNEEAKANIVTSLWNAVQDTLALGTVYAAEMETESEPDAETPAPSPAQSTEPEETLEEIEVTWELAPEYSVKDVFDGGVTLEDYFGVDENGDIDYASASQEKLDAYEDMNGAYYTYRAVLPDTDDEGNRYTLAEGVELPEIYVQIGESGIMTLDTSDNVASVTINEETTYYTALEKATAQTIPAGTKNYSYSGGSRGNTETVNVAEKVSAVVADAADCSYSLATSDANNILSEVTLNTQTGALSYKVPAQASNSYIGKEATLTVTIASANYEDMTYTQTVKLTEKSSVVQKTGAEVAISGSNQLTYGQTLDTLILNTDSAKFVEEGTDTEVLGELEWTTPKAKPGVKTTTAEWTFTPTDPSYAVLTGTLTIKVEPAEGTVSNNAEGGYATAYTFTGAEIVEPQSSNFTTNSGSTGFTYTWYRGEGTAEKNKLEENTRPSAVGTYTLKVDVAATENYTAATTTIKVTISSYTCGDAVLSAQNTGDAGADGWYHGTVLLTAPAGHTISMTQDKDSFGTTRSLEISGEQNGDFTYYLKQDSTDYITEAKTITVKIDTTNPTGSIGVKQTWWQTFLEVVTFGLYTNTEEKVTITAADETGSVNSGMTNGTVEYYISQTPYESIDNLKGAEVAWSLYNSGDKPTVSESATVYIYARITDTAGNVGYVSTAGIMYDNQKPTVTLTPSGTGYTDQAGHSYTYQNSAAVAVAVSDTLSGIDTVSCTLNGNTVAGVGNGSSITVDKRGENTLIVTATDNAGNQETKTLTVYIYGAAPTVTITPASSIVYDGAVIAEGTDFTLDKGGSAGTVTYYHKVQGSDDRTYVSGLPINAGNYTIKAEVAEDGSGFYPAAKGTENLTIARAQPAVTLNAAVNRTGGISINLTATVAPVSGGVVPTGEVKFYDTTTGSDVEISTKTLVNGTATYSYIELGTQIYKLKAVYTGETGSNYTTASSAEQSVDTTKQNQTELSIQSISAKTYGDAAFTLATSGGSGTGDVTFTSSDASVLSISGATATIHKAGTVTITAKKAADNDYNEATVQISVTIGKKALTITADDKLNVIKGSAMPTFTYTTSGLVNGDTITGVPTMKTTVTDTNTTGTYVISISGAVISNPDGYAVTYKAGTMTIVDQVYGVTVNNGTATVNGTAITEASEGQSITLTAASRSGYTFKNWSSNAGGTFANANAASTTFTMPANAVTITANYTQNSSGGSGNEDSGGGGSDDSGSEGSSAGSGDSGDNGSGDTSATTPTVQPTTPAVQPTTPAAQLTTPAAQPTAPAGQSEPSTQPTRPTVNSQPTAEPTASADPQAPFIEGNNGEQGWDVIKSDITDAFTDALEEAGVDISKVVDENGKIDLEKLAENPEVLDALANLAEPLAVIVNMNGSTELPADIISLIAGKNIDLTLEMEEGITWTINGNSVTGENISDIDLAVTKNSNTIPVDVINEVSGESYTMQIELSHNGEFGFTATLTINLESRNAGYYANLFYFNEETGELEFIGYSQIDENGNAALEFSHASAYTIVITEEPMNAEGTADLDEETETGAAGITDEAAEETGGNMALRILLGVIAAMLIAGAVILAMRKREETTDQEQ